jgi:hypothetical protein
MRPGILRGEHSRWNAMVLVAAFLAGCQTTIVQHSGGPRILTSSEMDQVTAGSAVAVNDGTARAFGSEAQTNVLGNASTSSGTGPIAGPPVLYYANSETMASASSNRLAETSLSSQAFVDGRNGGASIGATAVGVGTNRAQVTAQLYGISTNRADIVFGSVAAVACCGPNTEAEVTVNSQTGGRYSRELRTMPMPDTPGQVKNAVDIAVVSSALPILDSAPVFAAGAPTRASP